MNRKVLDLSVIIITLNEEANLRRCLLSLPEGCEVIVLDSGSSDQTEAIARTYGAIFQLRKFDHYAAQKNAASNLATRRWVFSIDADEELDSIARASIIGLVTSPVEERFTAYKIRRRLVFLGQIMRFGKTSDCPVRIFQRGIGLFVEPIHERLDISRGNIGPAISGSIAHHSYKNISDYFSKFNSYTSKIADNHFANKIPAPNAFIHCLRPWLEFISRYFLRLGFIDGKAGFSYALFSSLYAYVKYDKLLQMYRLEKKLE